MFLTSDDSLPFFETYQKNKRKESKASTRNIDLQKSINPPKSMALVRKSSKKQDQIEQVSKPK